MNDEIEIRVGSDPDHEDLVAELYVHNEFVLLISQESGFPSLDVEIHSRPDGTPWKFKLEQLEAAIAKAKKRLWELRREQ